MKQAKRKWSLVDRRASMDASQSPYQLTLSALTFPATAHCAFHLVAAISVALIGAPVLGIAWALACCVFDIVAQRRLAAWRARSRTEDTRRGLRHLALLCATRSAVLFAGPVLLSLNTDGAAPLIYTGLVATALVAAGVSSGWVSKSVYAAMVAPAPLALAIQTCFLLDGLPRAGVLVGLGSVTLILTLIALGTSQAVHQWSQAAARTRLLIEQLREALERSEAAERRLRVALEIADLHVYEMDFVRRTLVSQGAERTFFEEPLTYEQMWRDPFRGVHADDLGAAKEAWARHEAGLAPYRTEYRVRRSDGSEVWASAFGEIARDETGKPVSVVGALQNITASKRNELDLIQARDAAEAANRAKSEFLAAMSHEIRTPLNGVLGMAQIMERDALSAGQRERLAVIRKSGETLLALLNGLLDLAKIEAGKLDLEDGELDVEAIVLDARSTFEPLAAEKGLKLIAGASPDAADRYRGDPTRVRQVLFNLLSNAVKFTERGGVVLSITYADGQLTMAVTDTGIGIDPSLSSALFAKFVQADASTTRKYGGTGLGLAICRELVSKMGGEIELQSAPGRGSTFTVRLPVERVSAVPALVEADDAELGLRNRTIPVRILAAEDHEVNRLVLATMLEQVGIDATLVGNGQQAVEAWKAGDWDLILLDVQMPIMDGPSAARTIRNAEAATGRRRTPIVALTANAMTHQEAAYRAAGMDDVLAKPIVAGSLFAAIELHVSTAPEAASRSA